MEATQRQPLAADLQGWAGVLVKGRQREITNLEDLVAFQPVEDLSFLFLIIDYHKQELQPMTNLSKLRSEFYNSQSTESICDI